MYGLTDNIVDKCLSFIPGIKIYKNKINIPKQNTRNYLLHNYLYLLGLTNSNLNNSKGTVSA